MAMLLEYPPAPISIELHAAHHPINTTNSPFTIKMIHNHSMKKLDNHTSIPSQIYSQNFHKHNTIEPISSPNNISYLHKIMKKYLSKKHILSHKPQHMLSSALQVIA
jgi:hypothetical protein